MGAPLLRALTAIIALGGITAGSLAPGVGLADGPPSPSVAGLTDLGAGAAGPSAAPAASDQASELEMALFDRVNADRARLGLRPLELDVDLLWVARARAAAQVPLPGLSHLDADGRVAFADMLAQAQASYRLAGENLARVGAGNDAAGRADEALMSSPPHRAAILEPAFSRLAIGAANDENGGVIFAQLFRAV